jgi:hypothetical protein
MGVELGIWSGAYMNQTLPWLRWWDSAGNLLLSGEERAAVAEQRLTESDRRADESDRRAEQLAAKLRELGINPDEV